MGHFYFLLGLLALLLLSLGLDLYRRFGRRGRRPYISAPTLFPPAELAVLRTLEAALGPSYRVFGRVRAVDVIGLRQRLDRPTRRRALMRLWAHRFDFLICTAPDNRIAAALNLAPPSRFGRRPPRDALDRICAAAGLPFVRIRGADHHDPAALAALLRSAMRARASERRLDRPQARPPPAAPTASIGTAAETEAELLPTPAPVRAQIPARVPAPHREPDLAIDDAREPRLHPPRNPGVRPDAPPKTPPPSPNQAPDAEAHPSPQPRAGPSDEPAPRIEPILAAVGDLEPGPDFRGPDFRIGGHLEDEGEEERPLRRRH